ncbi:MAG TPA: prolyl oligopeptidase family serine peptidase [Bryobacteraceae bacterium]|nr:prolyl oligopeptidase family serine peptidase [Bryobacteraceae bacterium]
MNRFTLVFLLILPALCREPFSAADLWAWRTVDDPQITADGRWVVYVESQRNGENDAEYSSLRFVSADGKRHLGPAVATGHVRQPRWSPDGSRLAWIADGATIQVGRFEAMEQPVTAAGRSVPLSLSWSPDGKWLAFTAAVEGEAPKTWVPAALLRFLEMPARPVEIFVVPAAGGAAPRQLTHDSFVRRGPAQWTMDGEWIVNSAERAPDPANPSEGAEIYGVRVSTGEVRRLTEHAGPDEDPLPSPDGSKIAWIASETKPAAYAVRKLWVMGVDGKRVKALTGSLDRDVMWPQWSSDSRTMYFLADDRGSTHVYAARNDGTVRQVTSRAERLKWFSLADNGRAVTVRSSATAGEELVTFAVDLPGGVLPLAAPNEDLLATRDVGPREEVRFSSDGKQVQAWLVKPLGSDRGKPLPLLVEAGETPRTMCGAEFPLRAQIFAARGFAVVCVNARGTPGFGEDFGNLLRTRFPGDDFDDVMRGVDAVVAEGGIDRTRLFVAGGLTAAWALGHTDRFAAAVVRRPLVEWSSDVALSTEGYRRAIAWMGAMPWDDSTQYVQHSPIYFAQNFKTPTLVLGDDAQARELYFALQARKVESQWLRVPENPDPATEVAELKAELAWLERFQDATAR